MQQLRWVYRNKIQSIKKKKPHQFPENIDLENIGREHQTQHGESKQSEKRIVSRKTFFSFHISQTVDMYHQRNKSYHHQHHHRNRIEHNAHIDRNPS